MSALGARDGSGHHWFESLPRILSDLGVALAVGSPERVLYANEAFCTLTGYSAKELSVSVTLGDLVPPEARERILDRARRRVAGDAEPRHYETELLHRDGHRIPVDVSADLLEIDARTEIVALFRDIGNRKVVEAELATRARQQAVVAELGRQALVNPNVSALMDVAVDLVARTLDVEYAKVLEVLPGGEALLLRAGVGWRKGSVGWASVGAGTDSQAGYTMAVGGPVVVEDTSRETRFDVSSLLMDHGVVSGLTVLIRGEAASFGVLGVDTTRQRRFSDDDVHFLRAVANVLADAVARARIEADLATATRRQAAVVELGRQALVNRDVVALMDVAVDLVARALDVEYADMLEVLPGGETLLLRAGVGWKTGSVGRATLGAGSDSQAGYTLAAGGPVVAEDLSRESRFRVPPLVAKQRIVSGMSVVVGAARPWGVLGAYTAERRAFSADEARFLQAMAHVMAEAIERSEVDEALRAAHAQERQLRERLEAYARQAVHAQELERRHIARELHDEVGQILTGMMLTLENVERLPADAMHRRLDRARVLVNELLLRVRDLSLDLRPAILDDLGLAPALLWLVQRFTAQTGVEVALTHSGLDDRLVPDVETAAYRIAQEALTNVARHAAVARATLSCVLAKKTLVVEVTDQGAGFVVDAAPGDGRSGLVGMEERARATGGRLYVESRPGRGTRVCAELGVQQRPTSSQ